MFKYVIGIDVENKAGEEKLQHVSYFGPHLSGFWLLRKRMTEWLKDGRTGAIIDTVISKITGVPKQPPPFFKSASTTRQTRRRTRGAAAETEQNGAGHQLTCLL